MEPAPQHLYIGTTLVPMLPVQGQFFPFLPGKTVVEAPSVKNTQSALKRLQDCSELGPEYSRVYTPALPSADLLLKPGEPTASPLPVSVKASAPSDLSVVQSGKRSGVVRHEGCWYRLKGCGNLTAGFVVEPMAFPEDGRELRGCCFEHTLARELYMSHYIQEVLKPHGFEVGNVPIGYWKYESDPTNTVQFELPQIGKYCGVYRTLGEKRLGSHLLGGLEALLERLSSLIDSAALTALFPASRLSDGKLIHPKQLLSTSGPLDNGPFLDEFTAAGVYKANSQLLDLQDLDFSSMITVAEFPLSWVSADDYGRLETGICSSTLGLIQTLLALMYRIGREAGEVKRRLQDSEVSWGYFIDHNPFEPHCNAHPNNFLVLSSAHNRVTAPVDFDMAFTFRGFFNNIDDAGKGIHDYTLFQSFVNSERGALEEALMGVENMANFKYTQATADPTPLSVALRDQLLLGYREGFDLCADRHPISVQGNHALWSAVELCLISSADYVEY